MLCTFVLPASRIPPPAAPRPCRSKSLLARCSTSHSAGPSTSSRMVPCRWAIFGRLWGMALPNRWTYSLAERNPYHAPRDKLPCSASPVWSLLHQDYNPATSVPACIPLQEETLLEHMQEERADR